MGDYYMLARAADTNQPGKHLLSENTEWNFVNYGDPNGTNLDRKPTVVYAKQTSKSEQMNFAVSYARTFGKHDIAATAVVERAE
ncbi:MAG: hypothetical protein ACLUVG_06855 [Phocaeicola vulgatus]